MCVYGVCVCGCACYGNILGNYAYQNQTFACIVYENVRGRDMHTHTYTQWQNSLLR